MRIGIDISQIVYEGTGVGNYVKNLTKLLVESDSSNSYVLFASSLRRRDVFTSFYHQLHCDKSRVTLRTWFMPPTLLDLLWNVFHIVPIEWLIGKVDVFWSSDWTQPPLAQARGITTVHDLSILRFPKSFHKTILAVQKRRLRRIKKECTVFLCDSEATKQDMVDLLGVSASRLYVVYPGFEGGVV
jgi:hypothetical protein